MKARLISLAKVGLYCFCIVIIGITQVGIKTVNTKAEASWQKADVLLKYLAEDACFKDLPEEIRNAGYDLHPKSEFTYRTANNLLGFSYLLYSVDVILFVTLIGTIRKEFAGK